MKILIFLFCLFTFALSFPADAATYFAAPSTAGSANGSSSCANAFLINSFWALAKPGDTLNLCSGTYTGANSMIAPPSTVAGTSSARITIKALSESPITNIPLIDGESVRVPVRLVLGNNYFTLEGFDARASADTSGSGTCCPVIYLSRANNNIVRRVCAWDAPINMNTSVYTNDYGTGNVFEDICGFGIGRKIFVHYGSNGPITVRRMWGSWMNNGPNSFDCSSPKEVLGAAYEAWNGTFENILGTVDGDYACGYGALVAGDGHFGRPPGTPASDFYVNSKILGSIGYRKTGQPVGSSSPANFASRSVDGFEFRDTVFLAAPLSQSPLDAQAFDGGASGVSSCSPNCFRQLNSITTIGSVAPTIPIGGNGWAVTNHVNTATVAALGAANNIWNGSSGTGARVCYQYQNGTLNKSAPLWPWPMDARIAQALTRSGRTATTVLTGGTVTNQMEALFGPIPPACRGTTAAVTVSITTPATDPHTTSGTGSLSISGSSSLP